MQIEKIKNSIDLKLGDNVHIVCNGARNKVEEYSGIIKETYDNIFIVILDTDEAKSFCYSDILTKTVKLYFDK